MARLFGTDGVRGVVNEFLTPELAYHLGRAAGTHFGKKKESPYVLNRSRYAYFWFYA